jgi:hydrogenase assembly chaperone HypC/HupF
MCIGGIARLEEVWEDRGAFVGRLDDGTVVSLSFVPDATTGAYVLVHLGIPVEVLDADTARKTLALRSTTQPDVEVRE